MGFAGDVGKQMRSITERWLLWADVADQWDAGGNVADGEHGKREGIRAVVLNIVHGRCRIQFWTAMKNKRKRKNVSRDRPPTTLAKQSRRERSTEMIWEGLLKEEEDTSKGSGVVAIVGFERSHD